MLKLGEASRHSVSDASPDSVSMELLLSVKIMTEFKGNVSFFLLKYMAGESTLLLCLYECSIPKKHLPSFYMVCLFNEHITCQALY